MKQTELEQALQADPELDAVLARMAEEVPPVPADFHDRWMGAVRAEAGQTTAGTESANPGSRSSARWTRLLGIAAVFVFLIGGTLLYRSSGKAPAPVFSAKEEPLAMTAAGAPEEAEEEEAAAEDAIAADSDSGAAPAFFANAARESKEESAAGTYAAGAYEEASKAAPLATGMPTMPVPEPAEAPEESGEEPETGLLRNAGAFLADMGGFLLAALPYLAVLAVPAVIALILRRRKK